MSLIYCIMESPQKPLSSQIISLKDLLNLASEQTLVLIFILLKIAQTGTKTKILNPLYIIHYKTTYITCVLYQIGHFL